MESTCCDPARKPAYVSKEVSIIDRELERGWDSRFSMTTSLHNHQLHDCQREYFDVPQQSGENTQQRPAYTGVATTNSRFASKQRKRLPAYKGAKKLNSSTSMTNNMTKTNSSKNKALVNASPSAGESVCMHHFFLPYF